MANKFDSTNYPTIEPAEIIAGDFTAWDKTSLETDYPSASYTLKYSARLESGTNELEITANSHIVELSSAITLAYTVGLYHWQAYIIRNSDSARITLGTGVFEVVADNDTSTQDQRSHAKKVIDAIEAVIEKRATKDQENYSINGRSLQRTPITDLLTLRDRYKSELAKEEKIRKIKNGLGGSNKIKVAFK